MGKDVFIIFVGTVSQVGSPLLAFPVPSDCHMQTTRLAADQHSSLPFLQIEESALRILLSI